MQKPRVKYGACKSTRSRKGEVYMILSVLILLLMLMLIRKRPTKLKLKIEL